MQLALFEPDIPQNTGSILRLCACTGVALHVIEPCGFPFDEKRLKRVAMDYEALVRLQRHTSWKAFCDWRNREKKRLVLLTTKTDIAYTGFTFAADDVLLLGRESSGVPQEVRDAADASVTIPMHGGARSLNVALAASMVLGEALRQTR